MDVNKAFSEASQLIQRKLPHAAQVLKPKKKWMQTIPEKNCDVVMVMAPSTQESTVLWLKNIIEAQLPQLTVTVKNISSAKSFGIYLHASFDGLLRGAEEMRVVKRTKPEHGGSLKEFSLSEIQVFQAVDDEEAFFSTQERQSIVLHILNSLRAKQEERIEKAKIRAGRAIIPKLLSKGIIHALLPLHERTNLKPLKSKWVPTVFQQQPIDEIQKYFGSRIAFYFAWLGHYTTALLIPALIGIIFWVCLIYLCGVIAYFSHN
ncbi:Anoctamin-8 [Halocaridina rubra]|uniref:Anoctamin n=1 Tax=Halocaridina rubra TaxID=373956 RepID=A0AAN8WMZ2_HALRR